MKLNKYLLNKWVRITKMDVIDSVNIKKLTNIGMKIGAIFFVLYINHNNKMIHIILNHIEYAFRLSDLNFIEVEETHEHYTTRK